MMNFGQVGKVNATTVYVSYSNGSLLAPPFMPPSFQLKFLSTNSNATYLDIGQEGYFVLPITLQTGSSYAIKIVTWRGSIFESTFVA